MMVEQIKIAGQEAIAECLRGFDFASAHKIIQCMGYKWAGEEYTIGIIYQEAERMLKACLVECMTGGVLYSVLSSGSFTCSVRVYESSNVVRAEIKFIPVGNSAEG
jgi:hypothetical protein